MQTIDLTDYVVHPIPGTWSKNPEFFTPDMLTLVEPVDGVTLAGPLRIRVSVQAQNSFNVIGASVLSVQTKELFGYVLEIPPGQTWTYIGLPYVLRDNTPGTVSTGPAVGTPALATANVSRAGRVEASPPAATAAAVAAVSDAERQALATIARRIVPGVNDRLVVVIRAAGHEACADPCAPIFDPCKPPKKDCGCGCKPCHCHTHDDDLSCDFAVANTPDISVFFPAACEPCTPGASIGMPPTKGPSLIVSPARGGTVRTRYFNGMFMTSEDLETDQRNVRLKRALMNRALGQGVVWGLNLSLDGDGLCVFPGYGVDCCGNDIVLTTPYRVDAQALLRDPAAALAKTAVSSRAPRHFSVILEYFECPEQPRPVHGDPCAPETTRCETSRIRETARLRLAPPCELDDSGPIKDFLAEVEKLKKDPAIGPILAQPHVSPQAGAIAVHVPFTATFQSLLQSSPVATKTLTPKVGTNNLQDRVRSDIGLTSQEDAFRITLDAEPGFRFTSISVAKVRTLQDFKVEIVDIPLNVLSNGTEPTKVIWNETFGGQLLPLGPNGVPPPPQAEPIPAGYAYQIRAWRMRDATGNELSAPQTELQVTPLRPGDWFETPWGHEHTNDIPTGPTRVLHLQVLPSDVRAAGTPPPLPCFNECDPANRRFPVPPPWLHEDPTRPGQAIDPRVLALALLYSVLALETARSKTGTPNAVDSARLQVATAIYNSAWKLFFATVPDTERFRLTDALQRLLRAWCCALLYPGPTCHCEPHGVVIGCASVSGGRIQSVDPWGGRRWVVHYPLLSYWGQLFGITPLDALASKIFGLICCIAGLPVPGTGTQTDPTGGGVILSAGGSAGGSVPSIGRNSEVNLGRALLVVSPPAEAEARIATLGLRPTRVISVGPIDFVSRFTEALRADTDPTGGKRPLVHYTVLGLPDFHLVAPGDPERGFVPASEPGRLRDVVRATLARRPARASVPALLKTFTEDLSRNVISAMPIDAAGGEQSAAATLLADSGITTLGALLGGSAEELHSDVLKGKHPGGLAALVDRAETDAAAATKATADSVIAAAADTQAHARADFRSADRATDLGKRIADKLKALKLKVAAHLPDVVAETAGR